MFSKRIIAAIIGLIFLGIAGVAAVVMVVSNNLPKLITVSDYEPLLVSEVFDRDGQKIGEFAREKRILVPYSEIPEQLVQAFTSAEDASFFQHGGINYVATIRAFLANLRAGRKVQGGSTITMQVARSLLLSPEKTYTRKIKEIMLSFRMEKNLSKQDILYLYLNQIYLGHGAWGIGAAADIYFRKNVKDLTLSEMALLAGLPQAPSRYSPIRNPSAAKDRQRYVLKRMAEEDYIEESLANSAAEEPVQIFVRRDYKEKAPYYLETVRQILIKELGEEAVFDKGIKIYTGLDSLKQNEAQNQVRLGLRQLDKRQGFRGAKQNLDSAEKVAQFLLETRNLLMDEATSIRILQADGTIPAKGKLNLSGKSEDGNPLPNIPTYLEIDQIVPAVVIKIDDKWGLTHVRFAESKGLIDIDSMSWARKPNPAIRFDFDQIKKPSQALNVGDVIDVRIIAKRFESERIEEDLKKLKKDLKEKYVKPEDIPNFEEFALVELEQEPSSEGALIAIDQNTDELISLVGGYDFERSEFNRALQAARQTGSAFKPIVYASALDKGYTAATSILDSPIVYEEEDTEVQDTNAEEVITKKWKPQNHSKKFMGETLFRSALIRSLNVPTVKIIEKLGVDWVATYARRLGIFSPLNYDFTMALGSSGVTLYEMTKAFSVFGRLGKRAHPLLIHKVEDKDGKVLLENITLDDRYQQEVTALEDEFEARRQAYLGFKKYFKDSDENPSLDNGGKNNNDSLDANIPSENNDSVKDQNNQSLANSEAPSPYLKINEDSKTIDLRKEPPIYFENPEQILKSQTAFITTTLLQAAIEEPGGTGGAARALGRPVAGKTGSASGYYDGWFIGFSPDIATGVWVGFDEEKSLGKGEVGGRNALPIWIEYMKYAHEGLPIKGFQVPEKIVFANIDKKTGRLASTNTNTEDIVRQAFLEGTEPTGETEDIKIQEEKNFFKEDLSE